MLEIDGTAASADGSAEGVGVGNAAGVGSGVGERVASGLEALEIAGELALDPHPASKAELSRPTQSVLPLRAIANPQ